jgi:hypothetical protein
VSTNSLFDEPWWLDALAPGAWDAVEVERGGRIIARLPYVRRRRLGLTQLGQPLLTQSLGPWVDPGEGKYARRLEVEKELLTALIDGLPPFHEFQQSFSTRITNWLPFYWAGFTASVRYTYRLEQLDDLDAIWAGFAENARRQIRKAEKQVEVRDDLPFERFLELHAATYARQGTAPPVSDDVLLRLDAAASARGARRFLAAVDADGRTRAAVYVVHDARTAYYLLGGRHADFPTGGEPSLLLWSAIRAARETSAAFDFEGSMIESIERFFRSFGARQVPYFRVQRVRGPARALQALRVLRS